MKKNSDSSSSLTEVINDKQYNKFHYAIILPLINYYSRSVSRLERVVVCLYVLHLLFFSNISNANPVYDMSSHWSKHNNLLIRYTSCCYPISHYFDILVYDNILSLKCQSTTSLLAWYTNCISDSSRTECIGKS